MMSLLQLIDQAQSPDNNLRESAEKNLINCCDANPSDILTQLINIGANFDQTNLQLSYRQFALLSLRKLITYYWTPAFESFRNTNVLTPESKQFIRDALLKLVLDDHANSKIVSSASYCVVQISAVDFPDEWPQLLQDLYNGITQFGSINAINVLVEIFDDIISEDMFFDGGIGLKTLEIIFQLLNNENNSDKAQLVIAMKLFNATLVQMSTVGSHSQEDRKNLINQCIPQSLKILIDLLNKFKINSVGDKLDSTEIESTLQLHSKIFENLNLISNEFPKKLFAKELRVSIKDLSLVLINNLAHLSLQNSNNSDEESVFKQSFVDCTINCLDFISTLSNFIKFNEVDNQNLLQDLLILGCLDDETIEDWLAEYNEFVSKETGLMASFTIRDQIADYLISLNNNILQITFQDILQSILTNIQSNNNNNKNRLIESSLFMLQSLLSTDNDDMNLHVNSESELKSFIDMLFQYQLSANDITLSSRIILVIPKILDKFMDVLTNVKLLTKDYLEKSILLSLNTQNEIITVSILIAFGYYCYFAELPSVLGPEKCLEVQDNLLKIINSISHSSKEDTNGLLIESLNHIINCNVTSTPFKILQTQFTSVLSISSKDPSNIQIVVESQECLERLLSNVNTDMYTSFIEICLPSFVNIINSNETTNYKYSPLLSLILEFVTVFMKKKPSDGPLPSVICEYIFEPLANVLQKSDEEETLQLATDAFSYLIYNTESNVPLSQLPVIINILERLLSVDISDTGAMNVGTLIVSIFNKFNQEIGNILPQILKAAVTKLIQIKNISTQENLVSLLCYITNVDPLQTINFLFQMSEEESNPQLITLTFNKWFETFEIIRSEKKIKDNIVSLVKIFNLCDNRLFQILVNDQLIPYDGDLIITRSMAKKMPDRYTQVNVYIKIIKLFINELNFRNKQPDVEQLLGNKDLNKMKENEILNTSGNTVDDDEGDDDGDWEDVDDVLDYEKLQEYIQEDSELEGDDDQISNENEDITGIGNINETPVELLITFFKEVTSKNINQFQDIYSQLTDDERGSISSALV